MRTLAKYLRNYKKESILAPFFKFLEVVFDLLVPIVIAQIIDVGIAHNDHGYIVQKFFILILMAAAGLSAGGLGYLLGGTPMEAFVAIFVGCAVFAWSLFAGKHGISKILVHIVGGIIIASMALAAMQIPAFGNLRMEGIVTGGIMPLVPRLAFVNAIRDLADSDYLAGTVKMIDAVMVFVYIAIGVGAALTVYHHVLGGVL